MTATSQFDPYHKWFGIPAEEQPPNHYRLLRIALFESDAEVIENAYDKEMGNLKQQEHGSHAELVEPLSRELIAARTCLLDAKKRAAYDAELRGKRNAEEEREKLDAEHARRKTIDEQNRLRRLLAQTPVSPREASREVDPPGSNLEHAGVEEHHTARQMKVMAPLHAVDRLLARLAGDGNVLLHSALRVVAVLLPIIILAGGIWLAMRMEDDGTPPGSDEKSLTVAVTDSNVGARAGQERDDNGLKMKFCWCSPGKFTMGSPTDEPGRQDNEAPVAVTLTRGFWLGKYEVTQDQWVQVMGTTPWSGKTDAKEGTDYPTTYVSWDDAMEFCLKLAEQERRAGRISEDWQYTLPTEAQWEYACRAGSITAFSFGDDESRLGDFAWFDKNAYGVGESYAPQVGMKKSNAWGLHDMHGSVWEWCRDWCESKLPGGTNPEGPSRGSFRVIRGGSWRSSAEYCRSACRLIRSEPDRRGSYLGFRVAAVPSKRVGPGLKSGG